MNKTSVSLLLAAVLLASHATADDSGKARGWPDTAPLTKRSVIVNLDGGAFVRVDVLGEKLFRIRHSKTGQWAESGLNRYGIFTTSFPDVAFERTEGKGEMALATQQARLTINRKDGAIALAAAD